MTFTITDFQSTTNVSRETLDRLIGYADLLAKWQKAKNLVSNSTIDDMWLRHFFDSAQLYIQMKNSFDTMPETLLDIGSGAGFPGLVLGAMGIENVHMVESNGKKCSFMSQVARQMGINAVIHNERIEKIDPFSVDIITSRACAKITQLLEWSEPFLGNSGIEMWLLKGQTSQEELTEAETYWTMDKECFESKTEVGANIIRLWNIKRK
ncbi:16S rRNA (guanine(527)-N(7))-methyltransferase RsmG [Kordiimonas sp. SCSIO 12610]|uniref:16S rRNA (guanine(527)-N(7))-methyltransferase RsmG n=1 Tax=Kordiimonas sp. SCSIO 12610 TaxID=2829597 RepID=UPI00210E8B98|nr:16S rRNA (guanine(527)-N(7))-methyltransferase RsmG [Kordiimonas sp. SCSIO 12610]UTW55478.1 16S rRNA (guanine(527)-N(7))-methyltransferase RsmG [Kordiimonas sp. SCSIO 12610]